MSNSPSNPKEMASAISNFLNKYNAPVGELLDCMSMEHRTLQQLFTTLCLEWIVICADEAYRRDPRNEYSHIICKKLVEAYEQQTGDVLNPRLPFI